MYNYFLQLYKYRELLLIWTEREIKIRYKQSILGISWGILQPLLLMIIFTVVFSLFARFPTEGIPYPIFSYVGLLPWTFLSTSFSFGSNSLVTNMNLITKVFFPREILPLGSIGAGLFDFIIATSVFIPMLIFYKIHLTWLVVWIPLILTFQIILTMGITLLAAAIIVFYRDLRFIVPLGIQLWLFATPVVYSMNSIPKRYQSLLIVNPMTGIIEGYRQVLLYNQSPLNIALVYSVVFSIFIFIAGYFIFKRMEKLFADII